MIAIYHNPRCSKSRDALRMAQQFADAHGLTLEINDYQKNPLTLVQLATLQRQLGDSAQEMVRANEEHYAALDLGRATEEARLQALVLYPVLLQRPIVVYRERAVIGRPPERIFDLLR